MPVVESMIALVLVDQIMAQHAQCQLFPINTALQEPIGSPCLDLPVQNLGEVVL